MPVGGWDKEHVFMDRLSSGDDSVNKELDLQDEVLGVILRILFLKACIAGAQCNSGAGGKGMRAWCGQIT